MVRNEEFKLGMFADHLTGFLKNDSSVTNFLKLIEDYGSCSGLKINHHKSEILLLGNHAFILQESNVVPHNIHNIKVKKSVKILGVHFSHAFQARRKLNLDELISSIQHKLRIWKWRDLTIMRRIQIVKTFIIPILLYRESLITVGKDFVKQANKIMFDFIWKGKDKVKRSTLVSEIEDGGLKALHLESSHR